MNPSPSIEQPVVPPELLDFLRRYKTFYIVSHVEPDGDALASSLALASCIQRTTGKSATCYNVGPFDRREIRHLEEPFQPRIPAQRRATDEDPAVIILDCTGPVRIGALQEDIQGLPIAVIDHHATSEPFGDARFVVTTSMATCHLVQLVMEALGGGVTREEADLLLFGIATDTGFFRHAESDAGDLFLAVARLLETGASPKRTYASVFSGHSFASRRLLATLLLRSEPIGDGTGVISWETAEDTGEHGRSARDSDTLYQLLFGMEGIRAAALIREEQAGEVSGSLRSIADIDVSEIARGFGGGGHKRAAGFTTKLPLMEAVRRVREELEARLADPPHRRTK